MTRTLTAGRRSGLLLISTVVALSCFAYGQRRPETSANDVEFTTKEVRHELLMLPYLGVFDNLAYKVDGHEVTLLGQVTRPSLKSDAENAVKRIETVE